MGYIHFEDLPNEVIMVILTSMNFKEVLNCAKVSKRIREICQNEALWQKVNLHRHPNLSSEFVKIVIKNGCKYLNLKMAKICGNFSLEKPTKLKYLDISCYHDYYEQHQDNIYKNAEVLLKVIYFCFATKKLQFLYAANFNRKNLTNQKYSRLRCWLCVKSLAIFFIWADLALFYKSELT